MKGGELGDLVAFLAVAEERSFTRAAAKLGVSQSALSYTVRRLETRLGVRLLNRTTRSVAATEGGERLLRTLRPAFDQIDSELQAVGELRDKASGTVRITANDHAADTILWPAVAKLLPKYPDIKVEIDIDYGLTDIVADHYDAGVRFGDQVAKDMIAVRIGPDLRMAIVGAPSYFATRSEPKSPQDLVNHSCIGFRQPSAGGLYAWEFEKRGRALKVRVDGQLIFNRHASDVDRRARWLRSGMPHGRHRANGPGRGSTDAGPRRLVSTLFGLPPLLPESTPAFARVRLARQRAALCGGLEQPRDSPKTSSMMPPVVEVRRGFVRRPVRWAVLKAATSARRSGMPSAR